MTNTVIALSKTLIYTGLTFSGIYYVLFFPEEGNRFPKTLDVYIKVLLKCNESICHSVVIQLFKLSTKNKLIIIGKQMNSNKYMLNSLTLLI